MKVSEELVQHIYTKLWSVNRGVIEDAFESFEGKVFELNVEETKPLTAEHDPSDIEERVKALELGLELTEELNINHLERRIKKLEKVVFEPIEQGSEAPTFKRNVSIDLF